MALSVKNRSGESFMGGAFFRRYFAAGYVDVALTDGIKPGTLVYMDGADGYVKPADQTNDLPAMGICYGTTNRSVKEGWEDNPVDSVAWFPQNKGGDRMEMEKIASVRLYEDTAKFRMRDESLTGTVETAGTTALVGTGTAFTSELQVGDYIVVAGETVRQVDTITDDENATVSVAFDNTDSGLAVTAKSMKNKPVYLGENGDSGKFGALNDYLENITPLKPVTGDGLSQVVGWIENDKVIQIDLTMDLTGETV